MRTPKLWHLLTVPFVFGVFFTVTAQAQDWDVVLNGKAMHLNSSKDWNEENWGLGFEREFDRQARWVKVAVGNAFVDSNEAMSYMAGGGIKRRFRPGSITNGLYVDLGVIGFMMSREFRDGTRIFPGLLPALTVGTRRVAVNLTYLPQQWANKATNMSRSDPTADGIVFLQLKLDARMLGFGRRNRPALAAND